MDFVCCTLLCLVQVSLIILFISNLADNQAKQECMTKLGSLESILSVTGVLGAEVDPALPTCTIGAIVPKGTSGGATMKMLGFCCIVVCCVVCTVIFVLATTTGSRFVTGADFCLFL